MTDSLESWPQQTFGSFAPKMVELTDGLLYGEIWNRKQLSPRERSLLTVAALLTLGEYDGLRGHVEIALENGLTKAEIAEAFTHLAFYAGWPRSTSALFATRDLLGE